jgi:uncharacterized protein YjbI with pentapeptide repeats
LIKNKRLYCGISYVSELALNIMSSATNQSKYDILKRYVAGERDFNSVNLSCINLTGAVLKAVNLDGANLAYTNLTRINLSDSSLIGIMLCQAILVHSNLRKSNLQQADLSEANLKQAFLEEANLKGANLHRADLEGAYLHKALLHGADLRETKLIATLSDSAYYDENTKFDDDFDPIAAGMIFLGSQPAQDSPNSAINKSQKDYEFVSGNLSKDAQALKAFFAKERNNSFLVNKISSLLNNQGNRDGTKHSEKPQESLPQQETENEDT